MEFLKEGLDLNSRRFLHTPLRIPEGYPRRILVPPGTTWENLPAGYNPPKYTAPLVFENDESLDPGNPKLWADPANPRDVKHPFVSFEGPVKFSGDFPLNPTGPTGIWERGLLGKWGANFAVDPIITRERNGKLEVVVIKKDGHVQIPGGMNEKNERFRITGQREAEEEVGAKLDFSHAVLVYKGYVDDARNTDNSWTELVGLHLHGNFDFEPKGGDDADEAYWTEVNKELFDSLVIRAQAYELKCALSIRS